MFDTDEDSRTDTLSPVLNDTNTIRSEARFVNCMKWSKLEKVSGHVFYVNNRERI